MILVRIFFTFLILGPILIGIWNYYRFKKEDPSKATFWTIMINSAVAYAIAYNLIFFAQELFLVLGKKWLGLTSYLYHNNHSWDGYHEKETLMQGSGALGIFILGLIFLWMFQRIRNNKTQWKLVILWMAFHGLIQSIPQLMVAYFDPNTDLGQATTYLQLSNSIMVLLAILSIVGLALISRWFCSPLISFAPSSVNFDRPREKTRFILFIAVGAALAGSVLIVPFRIFPWSQVISPVIIFLFAIPWILTSASTTKNVQKISAPVGEKVLISPILILTVLLILFRIVLAPGVEF